MRYRFFCTSVAAGAAWLLILAGVTASAAQDADSELQRHFLAAREAQSAGNLSAAAQEYRAVLRLRPDLAEAYGNLGLIYYLQARFEDSATAFERAIALKPGLRGADLFLGIDYTKLYRARRAIPHLEAAMAGEPANKEARAWLASALWDADRPTEAVQQLRNAANDFPGDVDLLFMLGEGYRKSAEREVKIVLAASSRVSAFYHQVLGDTYTMQRDWEEAAVHYMRASELETAMPPRSEQVAGAYQHAQSDFDRGAFETAESELLSYISAAPKDLEARYLLGKTYYRLSLAVLDRLLTASPNSFRAHQLQAQIYEYREENEAALAEYRIVEQARPELPGLHYAIGHLLWKMRNRDQALAELEQELRLNPEHAEANAEKGAILVDDHKADQGIEYLQKALRLKPSLSIVHEELGKAFYQLKEFSRAEAELRQRLASDDEGTVHYLLGMVYKEMGRAADSRIALDQSRKIKAERLGSVKLEKRETATEQREAAPSLADNNPNSQYQLAVFLSEKRAYREALEQFRQLAKSDPRSFANQFNLAIAYLNARQPDEAIRILEGMAAGRPGDANTLGLLGLAYEAGGKLGQALEAYGRACEADPRNPDRYLDYTRLLMDSNRLEEAVGVVEHGLNLVQDKYALDIRLGSIQLAEGKGSDARKSFQEAIGLHPEAPLGYVAMAKSYLKDGADAEAAKVLSDARRRLAADFMLEYFYGLALVRLQRNAEAKNELESAIRLDPNVPEAHYELGRAYLALGQVEQARNEFERVIQLAPQHASAHYQLSRIYAKLGDSKKAQQLAEETKRLKQTELDEAMDIQRTRLERFQPVEVRQ